MYQGKSSFRSPETDRQNTLAGLVWLGVAAAGQTQRRVPAVGVI